MYLLQNGRKHDSWRLARPDPYSSAASFDGWRGDRRDAERRERERRVAESEAELAPWSARAWTWLLSFGWRRHGLIDFAEAPAVAA